MTYNRFIGNSPIIVPILIVAALMLVTWYRPATTRASDSEAQTTGATGAVTAPAAASAKP